MGDNLNEVIVQGGHQCPTGTPQLTFDAAWDLESTFDFGYAQITTDGGETYTSLECTDTVDDTDPALGNVGPGFGQGFNGENATPVFAPQTCDLSAYAGQTVGLAFRVFNDGGVHFDGFWVDNVAIDRRHHPRHLGWLDARGMAVRHGVQPRRGRGLHGAAPGLRLRRWRYRHLFSLPAGRRRSTGR